MFKINKKFSTDLTQVVPFIEKVSGKILTVIKSKQEILKIKVVLEEAIVNAMLHGNKLDPKKNIKVHVEVTATKIILDVHDEGKGFNFKKIKDPTKKHNVKRFSGRGVFLMRHFMDAVEFYDQGSGIRMIKKIQQA